MRALTIKQPYAQLLAIGVRFAHVSEVDTDYRGPVAIHAAAVPMTMADLKADCERDDQLWMYVVAFSFDQQDRLDDLPCGAIVGIVDLAEVVPVSEPGFMPLLGEAMPGEFVYVFDDPMEIMSVEKVRGKRDLWELDARTADAAWEAEQVATIADPDRVDFDKAGAEFKLELIHKMARRADPARWRFKDPELEANVARMVDGYIAQHEDATRALQARVRVDPRNAALKRLFDGAEWVSRARFERKVRRMVGMLTDEVDFPYSRDHAVGDILRLVDIAIAVEDRAKVEGRLEDLLQVEGDGELLGD